MPIDSTLNIFYGIWSFYKEPYNPFNKTIVANDILNNLFTYFNNLTFDERWSGVLYIKFPYILMQYTYFGNTNDAKINIEPIANYMISSQIVPAKVTSYNTVWDWYSSSKPASGAYIYIFSDLIPRYNLTNQFTNEIINFVSNNSDDPLIETRLITAIFIQGDVQIQSINSTSLNPKWRDSFFIMANALAWSDPNQNNKGIKFGEIDESNFKKFGNGAIYSNEENKQCGNPQCN